MKNKIILTTNYAYIRQEDEYSSHWYCVRLNYEQKIQVDKIMKSSHDKNNGYLTTTIELPRRPRTTGEKSQNNYYWKLIAYIAEYTGSDSGYIHSIIKSLAVGRGYPQKIEGDKKLFLPFTDMPEGKPFRDASVEEAIILIECAESQCIDLGINIEEKKQ